MTLIVDGNNLTIQGFFALKNHFYKGRHIGAIYHFLNTLRRMFELYNLDKIVVFFDGENSSSQRKELYPFYKNNGHHRNEEETESFNYQKNRIKQYLEEVFVRQGEYDNCEADDCIAYYVQNSPDEKKIIFSTDGDLTQLVSEKTQIYNPSHHKLYNPKDTYTYEHEDVLIENISVIKMVCGDPSDNITGIKNVGIKTLKTLLPEITTQHLTLDYVKQKIKYLSNEDKNNKAIQNILDGETKFGKLGDDFFNINHRIIDLSNPLVTDEAILGIKEVVT